MSVIFYNNAQDLMDKKGTYISAKSLEKTLSKSGPSEETISTLRLFARCYNPVRELEDGWFDKHSLT